MFSIALLRIFLVFLTAHTNAFADSHFNCDWALTAKSDPSSTADEIKLEQSRARFILALKQGRIFNSDAKFVSVLKSDNVPMYGRVVGTETQGSRVVVKVMFSSGLNYTYDPAFVKIFSSSESLNLWSDYEEVFSRLLKEKRFFDYQSYFLFKDPQSELFYPARAIGFLEVDGVTELRVAFPSGKVGIIDSHWLKSAVATGEKAFLEQRALKVWDHAPEGFKVTKKVKALSQPIQTSMLPRNPSPLELGSNAKMSQAICGSDGVDREQVFSVKLLGQETTDLKLRTLALSLKQKREVGMVYSHDYNLVTGSNASFNRYGSLSPSTESELFTPTKLIILPDLTQEVGMSDTVIHELGHMQTDESLKKNIEDPLSIFYIGNDSQGKRIALPALPLGPATYTYNSRGDEARQHAYNFWNATHQRPATDIAKLFAEKPVRAVVDVFGLTRENFYDALNEARERLGFIESFDFRGIEMNQLALGRVGDSMQFKLTRDKDFYVYTPKGAVVIRLTQTLNSELLALTKPLSESTEFQVKLQAYFTRMLEQGIVLYQAQQVAVTEASKILQELAKNPDQQVTHEKFLRIQDILGRVKTSVNLRSLRTP